VLIDCHKGPCSTCCGARCVLPWTRRAGLPGRAGFEPGVAAGGETERDKSDKRPVPRRRWWAQQRYGVPWMAADVASAAREGRLERMHGGMNSTMQIQAEQDAEDENEMLASLTLESEAAATAEVRRRAEILSHGSSATHEAGDNADEHLMQSRDDALRVSLDEADDWLRKGKPGQRPVEDGDEDMAARIANDVAVNAIFAQVDGRDDENEPLDEVDQEEADEDEYAREIQREMMELMPEAARPEEPHRPQTASAQEVEQELEREVERMISEDEDEDENGTVRKPKDGSSGGKAQVFTLDEDDGDVCSEVDEREQQASMEESIAAAVESVDTTAPRVDAALPPGALPLRPPSGFGAAPMTPRNDLDPDSEMNFVASLRDGQMADFVNKSAKERLGTPGGRPGSRGGGLTPLQPLGQGLAGTIRPGSRGLSR
jgi:hypothetical protein